MPIRLEHFPPEFEELVRRVTGGETLSLTLGSPVAARRTQNLFYRWRALRRQASPALMGLEETAVTWVDRGPTLKFWPRSASPISVAFREMLNRGNARQNPDGTFVTIQSPSLTNGERGALGDPLKTLQDYMRSAAPEAPDDEAAASLYLEKPQP